MGPPLEAAFVLCAGTATPLPYPTPPNDHTPLETITHAGPTAGSAAFTPHQPTPPVEYDGIEYAALPVNCSVIIVALCCNRFRLSQRADN